jgi:hypothetical protein
MWNEYPKGTPDTVATLVGGPIGKNITDYKWETCCIRLSRALNYGGRPITGFSAIKQKGLATGQVRAGQGADKLWYIYSCYDLRAYLEARFGNPKRFGSYEGSDLSGITGVIMFEARHVDLWNGSEVRYNTDFTDGSKTVKNIYIWAATPEPEPAADPTP